MKLRQPKNGTLTCNQLGATVLALGHCVASVAVVNDEVFVTHVVRGDGFGQRRLGLEEGASLTFTRKLDDGWERDAVLRRLDPPPSMYEPGTHWLMAGLAAYVVLLVVLVLRGPQATVNVALIAGAIVFTGVLSWLSPRFGRGPG